MIWSFWPAITVYLWVGCPFVSNLQHFHNLEKSCLQALLCVALICVCVRTVGWICRLMAVSWTGWALAWLREEWRACGLIVEWKMVACWLGVEGWWGAGLGSTGTGCCDGWTEAVCSSWPVVLWEPWLCWTTNCCCCLCCWTRECGWIWVYAGTRTQTLISDSDFISARIIC